MKINRNVLLPLRVVKEMAREDREVQSRNRNPRHTCYACRYFRTGSDNRKLCCNRIGDSWYEIAPVYGCEETELGDGRRADWDEEPD